MVTPEKPFSTVSFQDQDRWAVLMWLGSWRTNRYPGTPFTNSCFFKPVLIFWSFCSGLGHYNNYDTFTQINGDIKERIIFLTNLYLLSIINVKNKYNKVVKIVKILLITSFSWRTGWEDCKGGLLCGLCPCYKWQGEKYLYFELITYMYR